MEGGADRRARRRRGSGGGHGGSVILGGGRRKLASGRRGEGLRGTQGGGRGGGGGAHPPEEIVIDRRGITRMSQGEGRERVAGQQRHGRMMLTQQLVRRKRHVIWRKASVRRGRRRMMRRRMMRSTRISLIEAIITRETHVMSSFHGSFSIRNGQQTLTSLAGPVREEECAGGGGGKLESCGEGGATG